MSGNPEAIARCIRNAKTIAVASHINPDGDTLGSAAAMALALEAAGKAEKWQEISDRTPDLLRRCEDLEEALLPALRG